MLPLRLCSIACVTEPINNVLHELFHGSLELIRARILRVDRLALGIHEMELTESTVSGVHDKSAHLGDFDRSNNFTPSFLFYTYRTILFTIKVPYGNNLLYPVAAKLFFQLWTTATAVNHKQHRSKSPELRLISPENVSYVYTATIDLLPGQCFCLWQDTTYPLYQP